MYLALQAIKFSGYVHERRSIKMFIRDGASPKGTIRCYVRSDRRDHADRGTQQHRAVAPGAGKDKARKGRLNRITEALRSRNKRSEAAGPVQATESTA
jgi:hypothetical protein